MIVDEGEFSEMAEHLGIGPKDLVNTVLESVKSRSWYVYRAGGSRSLGKSLQISLNSSELAYAWDEAIKDVVGGREYIVEECDVDLVKGTIWYGIVLPEGDDSEIDRLDLYFGDDPGEIVRASVDVVFADGKLEDEAMEEIDEVLGGEMIDCDGLDFEHDYDDGIWSFAITVHTSHDFELPRFDQMHDLVKKIKKVAKAHATNRAGRRDSAVTRPPPAPHVSGRIGATRLGEGPAQGEAGRKRRPGA